MLNLQEEVRPENNPVAAGAGRRGPADRFLESSPASSPAADIACGPEYLFRK
jgi:hypothetical protein